MVVGPCLDQGVQLVPRTGSLADITVTLQHVILGYTSGSHSAVDQTLECVYRQVVRYVRSEISHDAETESVIVVVVGVSPYGVPAPPLIDVTVLPDNEAISNVWPTVCIHVVVLIRLDEFDTVRLCVTSVSSSMVNVHVTRNSRKWSDVMRRCSRMPFTAAYDWRTSGCRVGSRTSVVRV